MGSGMLWMEPGDPMPGRSRRAAEEFVARVQAEAWGHAFGSDLPNRLRHRAQCEHQRQNRSTDIPER